MSYFDAGVTPAAFMGVLCSPKGAEVYPTGVRAGSGLAFVVQLSIRVSGAQGFTAFGGTQVYSFAFLRGFGNCGINMYFVAWSSRSKISSSSS